MSFDNLHKWESSIWQWRSGGLAVYEAGIVGLASAFCACISFAYHLSLRKALLAFFNLRNIGLFLTTWALQSGLMIGTDSNPGLQGLHGKLNHSSNIQHPCPDHSSSTLSVPDNDAVHTKLLGASSPMPLAIAYLKPLQRWKRPVGQLSAVFGSLSATQSALLYLAACAAVSWASMWCFMILLQGTGALHKGQVLRPPSSLEVCMFCNSDLGLFSRHLLLYWGLL